MAEEALRRAVAEVFPPVDFAMAYGSAVFAQSNHDASASMIDLVLAVEDPTVWHAANLAKNGEHYSFLMWFGAGNIARIQENYGAGVYYNTLVPVQIEGIGKRLIKYGVVRSETLCQDLRDWETLYLSGRMHKPVSILTTTEPIQAASSQNLTHALQYALLCLPEMFRPIDLFMRIASISYLGDFRMRFGENPRKVRNIVEGNFHAFQDLYRNQLQKSPYLSRSIVDGNMLVANTGSIEARAAIVQALPAGVRRRVCENKALARSADRRTLKKAVQRATAAIVQRYSRTQSIKGIATAGAIKSVQYVAQKLRRVYFKRK